MKEQMKERENLKLKRRAKREKLKERGITLIALVVTIIILLILVGVTLNIALSDNGLFEKAKGGTEKYKEAQTNEEELVADLEKEIDNYGGGNPSTVTPTPPNETPTPMTIKDAKAKDKFDDTTEVEDGYGNIVVIPGEFKIATDSGETVQEGIVIEDSDGNQFVWIPVSNIDGTNSDADEKPIVKNDGTEVTITLGRYSNFIMDGETMPTPDQKGSEYEEEREIGYDLEYFKEISTENRTNGRKGAKNLQEFINSVKKNHGYYIARYEASFGSGDSQSRTYGTDGEGETSIMENQKPEVKKSIAYSEDSMDYTKGTLWNFITQEDASKVSQNMYKLSEDEGANYVESDLVNSYAWDTAIVYIQAMGNENYANAHRGDNKSLMNTGETEDVKCNIYDMAGNVCEEYIEIFV